MLCILQHPNTGGTQRLPSGQILTIQPQTQPQTVVRQAVPAPVNVSRAQPGIRVSMPGSLQTVVRTTVPGGTSTVGQSHGVPAGQPSTAAQGNLSYFYSSYLNHLLLCKFSQGFKAVACF